MKRWFVFSLFFDFQAMSRKNLQDGVNDVDKIILKGATAQLGQCKKIAEKKPTLENFRSEHGYYELDNNTKYSIAFSPVEDCYYARGAHFGWNKVDSNDHMDYPPRKIDMARQWPGREVVLTDGGHRDSNEPITISAGFDNDLIPVQFR